MLNFQDLNNGFLKILENTKEYSENIESISQRWTDVFETFYKNQIMPISGKVNSNLYFSLQNFKYGLIKAIKFQTIITELEILIMKLHLGICNGVDMTNLYITTFPSFPLILKSCFNSKFLEKEIASKLALTIFNWVSFTFSTQISSEIIIKWM